MEKSQYGYQPQQQPGYPHQIEDHSQAAGQQSGYHHQTDYQPGPHYQGPSYGHPHNGEKHASTYTPQHSGEQNGNFDAGLCGCFGEAGACLCGCCLPCMSFGRGSKYLELQNSDPYPKSGDCSNFWNGPCCFYYLLGMFTFGIGSTIYGIVRRGKMREKYSIEGSCCKDFWTHCCCHCCALIQEDRTSRSREARVRGFNQHNAGQYV